MKTLLIALAFLVPSVSFAAQLSQEQATALINVVKASPATPAADFVPLITAFSTISNSQAGTLIKVIQANPTGPENVFVEMLLAFTVDMPQPVQQPSQPNPEQQAPELGNQQPTPPQEPVVQLPPMDTTAPVFGLFAIDTIGSEKDGYKKYLRLLASETLDINATEGVTMGEVVYNDRVSAEDGTGQTYFHWGKPRVRYLGHYYQVEVTGLTTGEQVTVTVKDTAGNAATKTVTVN